MSRKRGRPTVIPGPTRVLTAEVPEAVYVRVQRFAKAHDSSVAEIVRKGLARVASRLGPIVASLRE